MESYNKRHFEYLNTGRWLDDENFKYLNAGFWLVDSNLNIWMPNADWTISIYSNAGGWSAKFPINDKILISNADWLMINLNIRMPGVPSWIFEYWLLIGSFKYLNTDKRIRI